MPRGVRLNPQHDERTRAKIQTSQIINRLFSFVNGKVDMSPAQVTAALGLLKKTLPDLSSIDLKAEINDARPDDAERDARIIELLGQRSEGRIAGPSGAEQGTNGSGKPH